MCQIIDFSSSNGTTKPADYLVSQTCHFFCHLNQDNKTWIYVVFVLSYEVLHDSFLFSFILTVFEGDYFDEWILPFFIKIHLCESKCIMHASYIQVRLLMR